MYNGRIESYIHSDAITKNKGGTIVKIITQTDFAAKSDKIKYFTSQVAKFAYAANSEDWNSIITIYPELESDRITLEDIFKEKISVAEIKILNLEDKLLFKREWTKEEFVEAVNNSTCFSSLCKNLGYHSSEGLMAIRQYIEKYNVDISHFGIQLEDFY